MCSCILYIDIQVLVVVSNYIVSFLFFSITAGILPLDMGAGTGKIMLSADCMNVVLGFRVERIARNS